MDDDFDDLASGDEIDFELNTHDDDALSLLLADHPANQGAAVWE